MANLRTSTSASGLEARLLALGLLNATQLELAQREVRRLGKPLAGVVVELGFVTAETVARVLAGLANVSYLDLATCTVDRSAVELVPRPLCRRYRAVPVARQGPVLTLAIADPLDLAAIDAFRQKSGLEIDVVVALERDLLNYLDQLEAAPRTVQNSIDRIIEERDSEDPLPELKVSDEGRPADGEGDGPVIELVSQIIARAVACGASDIHLEPEEKLLRIRLRVDGQLRPDFLVPKPLQAAVVARMKVLAEMDVAEDRVPQDGRATVFVHRRQINLRVSSLPTQHGESVVVRILDAGTPVTSLASLGMDPAMAAKLQEAIASPYGLIMVTGPTGSGKTTTLYTLLGQLDSSEQSIFTLEDPVELRRPGLRQTQIREEVGLTFASGLRALLRQDPDVILVGETRDTETAQLLVRAALTGHLVFSTLHTNDAPGAIPRLLDMGVEPYLLPGALVAVLAQRLVRRLCVHCRVPVADPEQAFAEAGLVPPPGVPLRLWQPGGCAACHGHGYRGRQAIFELMEADDSFHRPIVNRAGTDEFVRLARAAGMTSMFEDGIRHALSGTTTLSELLRVARPG
jgi:type IV pilus assembly protein PilB